MDPVELTRRPDAKLFYARGDANDRRLGDLTFNDPDHYAQAEVVFVGCPVDEGVARNHGRPGAAEGPRELRRWLYRLAANAGVEGLMLFDLGDVAPARKLEDTHGLLETVVRQVLLDGKRVVVFGGGNDISYPDMSALAAAEPGSAALNIDAHYDVRADSPRNSGTPYRMLLDEGRLPRGRFHEVASQDHCNSPVYRQYLADKGAQVHPLEEMRRVGVERYFRELLPTVEGPGLFFGFDLDSVRAADAPGVSAPSPTGLDAGEACAVARAAGADARWRVFEVTELNPKFDLDGRTARLAALLVWNVLRGHAERLRREEPLG